MKESELKTLIQQSHIQPLRISMDDGRAFTVSHPDFAFVANDMLVLASGPKHGLGGNGLVLCPLSHIAHVAIAKKKSRTAA